MEQGSKFFILMENCKDGDLSKRIKKQQGVAFEEKLVQKWIRQITEALVYCHAKKILHRDLKPQNIFLKDDEVINVVTTPFSEIDNYVTIEYLWPKNPPASHHPDSDLFQRMSYLSTQPSASKKGEKL